MKKIMLATGAISVASMTAGLLFKFNHMPGASLLIVLGVISLSFVFLPLMFILRIREKSPGRDKAIVGIGTLAGILISLSVLMKIMHWSYANMVGSIALGTMLLVFLPVYFFTGIRNAETKVNTIVSSVFIFFGCALMLTLIRSNRATEEFQRQTAQNVLRNEQILSEQQKQTAFLLSKTSTNTAGTDIFQECQSVKTFLITSEIGNAKLQSGQQISEMDANDYIARNPEIETKVSQIQNKIQAYNQSLQAGQMPITSVSDLEKSKVATAINDLIQAQMVILQNQSALVLK